MTNPNSISSETFNFEALDFGSSDINEELDLMGTSIGFGSGITKNNEDESGDFDLDNLINDIMEGNE